MNNDVKPINTDTEEGTESVDNLENHEIHVKSKLGSLNVTSSKGISAMV